MYPARSLEPRLPGEQGNVIVERDAWSHAVIHCTDLCLFALSWQHQFITAGHASSALSTKLHKQSNFSTGWMFTHFASVSSSLLLFSWSFVRFNSLIWIVSKLLSVFLGMSLSVRWISHVSLCCLCSFVLLVLAYLCAWKKNLNKIYLIY